MSSLSGPHVMEAGGENMIESLPASKDLNDARKSNR